MCVVRMRSVLRFIDLLLGSVPSLAVAPETGTPSPSSLLAPPVVPRPTEPGEAATLLDPGTFGAASNGVIAHLTPRMRRTGPSGTVAG